MVDFARVLANLLIASVALGCHPPNRSREKYAAVEAIHAELTLDDPVARYTIRAATFSMELEDLDFSVIEVDAVLKVEGSDPSARIALRYLPGDDAIGSARTARLSFEDSNINAADLEGPVNTRQTVEWIAELELEGGSVGLVGLSPFFRIESESLPPGFMMELEFYPE